MLSFLESLSIYLDLKQKLHLRKISILKYNSDLIRPLMSFKVIYYCLQDLGLHIHNCAKKDFAKIPERLKNLKIEFIL